MALTADRPTTGDLLRHWRHTHGMSQLGLALECGISARHLSFIETGRSRPSRDVVLALAHALALPLRERNALLEASGHAREYPELPVSSPGLSTLDRALTMILERQEPFGAVVLDRHWNVIRVNRGQRRLLARLLPPERLAGPLNHMDLIFDPAGLRPAIANWPEVARALMQRLHREVLSLYSDAETVALRERLLRYPDIPAEWTRPLTGSHPAPYLEIALRTDALRVSLFAAITTVGTPLDVTVQEIRIESFFPADAESERVIRALAD